MSEKEIKATEWIQQLEEYAKENQLPMRMMDSLEECKNQMKAENADWDKVTLMVTEVLGSIEKKALPQKPMDDGIGNDVSMKDIEDEMRKMAKRCHLENEEVLQAQKVKRDGVIKNLFLQLGDITKTKAHFKELKQESLYHQMFKRIEVSYENGMQQILKGVFSEVCKNHNRMLEKIRSMMRSIKGHKNGISSEKIIYEYEEKIELMNKKYQSEIETYAIGSDEVKALEQETAKKVKGIVKKTERKKKILLWFPVIVIVCLVLAVGVVGQQGQAETAVAAEENADMEKIAEVGTKIVLEVSKTQPHIIAGISSFFIGIVQFLGASLIVIAIVLVVVILIYIYSVRQWCNKKICEDCAVYLQAKVAEVEKNNGLKDKVEASMLNLVKDYEEQYLELILNPIFADNKYAEGSQNTNRFSELKEEWNKIKYM